MMKNRFLIVLCLLLVTGCSQTSQAGKVVPKDTAMNNKESDKIEQVRNLTVDSKKFRYTAGWLSNEEILYVEQQGDSFVLKSFNLSSGKNTILFKESSYIIDVLVHSSKEYILLHTGSDNHSATVKIITKTGAPVNEITVESSEVSVEWNDLDPMLLLITAFDEDWSYDVFLYQMDTSDLALLTIENPFPKWIGKDEIIYSDLNENEMRNDILKVYNLTSKEIEDKKVTSSKWFDTYKERLLTIDELDGVLNFIIYNLDGADIHSWSIQTTNDEMGTQQPTIEWLSEDEVITSILNDSKFSEDSNPVYVHRHFNGNKNVNISEASISSFSSCTPNGERCLFGSNGEIVYTLKSHSEERWMSLYNE